MMKNIAKIIIFSFSLLAFSPLFASYGTDDVASIKAELEEVKVKLRSAKGANKSRLMKRMAKLENKLTETSSADRKRSK